MKTAQIPDSIIQAGRLRSRARYCPILSHHQDRTTLLFTTIMMETLPLDDQVLSALEQNPYLPRRNLRFETSEGRVTLRGVVGTYFQKQMAQESLRHVDGVLEIANELEVSWL